MRKFIYITFLLSICGILQAQEYQLEEIENLAYDFLNSESRSVRSEDIRPIKKISSINAISRGNKTYLYVANTDASSGWAILSNEKMYSLIIAHGDTGNFIYDENLLPPALLCILNNHMDAIDSIRNYSHKFSKASSTASITIYTSPNLISKDKWKQSCNNSGSQNHQKTYNKYVPHNHSTVCQDDCGKDPVGCGPVAMSKIMRYWQWPDSAHIGGVHDTTYYYDWEHMPTAIYDNSDMYSVDAVAHLFRSCGQAAITAYTCSGSATVASQIQSAMSNEFNFHSTIVDDSDIDVSSTLIEEIDHGRPVIVQAYQKTIFDGHSFVVDGYRLYSDGSTKFHIHWGWGQDNNTNNYYDIDFDGYKNGQKFLIEIYPLCNTRNNDVSLTNSLTINENQTYYSTNNVTVCSNNNPIVVNDGGHLFIKAGNKVYLKNGFHARLGSNVHVKIDSLCYELSEPQLSIVKKIAVLSTPEVINDTFNDNEDRPNKNYIVLTAIYTAYGQLIKSIEGDFNDINHLSQGLYVLRYYMSDGSIKSQKIRK